jgi:hypothetical protein
MDELDQLSLSTGAQMLVFDLANGCKARRTSGGSPCIVMPSHGGPMPMTKGQIGDSAVEELSAKGLIHFFGEAFPQPFRLTLLGEAYYECF